MLWVEEKYLRLLSPQLDRFTQKHPHVWNFRCPLCGDSEWTSTKARGYCFTKGQVLIFKCHNCAVAIPLAALLRRLSPRLYDEYMLEMLKERGTSRPPQDSAADPVSVPTIVLSSSPSMLLHRLDKVSKIDAYELERKAVDYALSRIPEAYLDRLYVTTNCRSWLHPLVGDKAEKVADGEPYLVFPLTLPTGEWYGAQVRLLSRKEYITFRWAEEPLKVFGLDRWDPAMTTYIVEGPFDSLFMPNAIAACGSDLLGVIRILQARGYLPPKTDVVYVWDNEPRNAEVVRHLRTAVRLHERVVIWKRSAYKDINDMYLVGINPAATIIDRTFMGLRAELEFQAWQR